MSERWKKKVGKINISILNFLNTVHLICTHNLKTLAPIGAEKSVTEFLVGEKEKRTNKGTDKPYVVDSLLNNTTHHYQALYQISEY